MHSRIKLGLLIFFCALAAISSYGLEAIVGDVTRIDWRFWVASSPSILVRVIFGFSVEKPKQLVLYSVVAALTDICFVLANIFFEPARHAKAINALGNSLIAYLGFSFVLMAAFSAICFCISIIFAFLAKRIIRFSGRRLGKGELPAA
jgi:hypothetical protein